MDRRTFIKVTAITGTSATLARCGNPENQIIRFIPDEELVPGVAVWKPSVCPLCAAGCGLVVRVMDGDVEVVRNGQPGVVRMGLAKKIEGNPADPINRGKTCARGQAAIQLTYHPDRIGEPLRRSGPRGSGTFQRVSWDEALAELAERLDALRSAGRQSSLGFVTDARPTARNELAAQFVRGFGAPPLMTFELFGDGVLRRANGSSFGHEQLPTVDFAQSRYVLSFGADLLGTWNAPVPQTIAYGEMRQGREGRRGKFVQVEARMSQTGASADEWVPVRPGSEGVLALGLAHVIVTAGIRKAVEGGQAGALVDGWATGLADYTPAAVERRTGVSAARIERLAREFAGEAPAVALVAGPALAHTNGLSSALAVNALNALVGSVGVPGGLSFMPRLAAAADRRSLDPLRSADPPLEVLLVADANPVFATPPAWGIREAIERTAFVASFSSFLDETSALADLILPDHSFLESWVDARPESGGMSATVKVAGPVMRPLHQTRAMPDVLLEVGQRLRVPLNPPLQWTTFEEMLRATVEPLSAAAPLRLAPARSGQADESGGSTDAWSAVVAQGFWSAPPPPPKQASVRSNAPARSAAVPSVEPQFDGDPAEYPFHFLPFPSQALLDGSLAHLPWLQEMPDPLTTAMWSTWVEINPQTAARLQIADRDLVEVRSAHGAVHAPALLSPGIAPDIIAMPAGQGHQTFTRYATGRGANPVALLAPIVERETGALAWAATRVRIARVSDGRGELILFAGATRERPHRPSIR